MVRNLLSVLFEVSSSFLLVSLAVHPELGAGLLPRELWPVCFVFHVKVMYAFAVDHYGSQAGHSLVESESSGLAY